MRWLKDLYLPRKEFAHLSAQEGLSRKGEYCSDFDSFWFQWRIRFPPMVTSRYEISAGIPIPNQTIRTDLIAPVLCDHTLRITICVHCPTCPQLWIKDIVSVFSDQSWIHRTEVCVCVIDFFSNHKAVVSPVKSRIYWELHFGRTTVYKTSEKQEVIKTIL